MKQVLALTLLGAILTLTVTGCSKKQQLPAPLPPKDIAQEESLTASQDFLPIQEEQITPPQFTPVTQAARVQEVKPLPAAKTQEPAPKQDLDKKEKPEPLPKSYVKDGRYFHPWAKNPVIKNGQDLYPAPWAHEHLQFGVHYSFVRAGTAYIKTVGVTETDFGPAYKIETVANSAKVIDHLFKVRDYNYSWIGVKDYNSYGYSQSIREGRYVRDEWLTFDTAKKEYKGILKRKEDPFLIKGELPGPVQDMLTSLYYVRTQDLAGDIIFDVANREKVYPLIVKFVKKEKVKVPAGTFNCVVVEPQFRGEGIFTQKGKALKVWLTDDERKLPVKMEAEVFIGKVSASLEEYKLTK